ncbi:MAG: integrase [Spirochaetia bacterium]|nr:integrase [Clostridia bacterium]NCC90323.1 integrase [Spirochaetia bacterium]NLO61660.1 tyrosine-type recombinase/integrase [Spirochaetales bacterium]
MNLEQQLDSFLLALTEEGYPPKSCKMYRTPIKCLIRSLYECENRTLDRDIVDRFLTYHVKRHANGEISSETVRYYKRAASRFLHYIETGNLYSVRKMTPKHGTAFEAIMEELRTDEFFSGPDRYHMISSANQFFLWLEEMQCFSPSEITLELVRGYMLERSAKVSGQTLYGDQRRLKILTKYFVNHGLADCDFSQYLSLPIATEKKILPAMSQQEIYDLLTSIDQSTAQGKKDYAIVLLGVVTGLRAIDIISLELPNIDWRCGEININQSKTGVPLALPLTKDVGQALKSYILKARPKSKSTKVFVHHRAPFDAYEMGSILSSRFKFLCGRAGIECKGFHSLRRSVGQRMTIAEIPLMTTSQILGHSGMDITKRYISLDSRHLSICALPFDGIKPTGGIYG